MSRGLKLGLHGAAVGGGAVALDPDYAVMLGDLIPTFGVLAEVAILQATTQKEESRVLQQSERVGSIGRGER